MPKFEIPEISIARLLQSEHLEAWEKSFLKIVVYRTLSKAETIVLRAISQKLNSVHNSQTQNEGDDREDATNSNYTGNAQRILSL